MGKWNNKYNGGHIQLKNYSLKVKLQALNEQRQEPWADTVKAVIEAGIVALTLMRDDNRQMIESSIHLAFTSTRKEKESVNA